ncbi:MAG TPA: NADPH-dependent F420 reductase [Polyangiaceae bacterium]|jgi:NADPH-dependent F420 reductase|nr:NADPH-dependent F420 reductase [Polyangiaceae bacterium]
MRLAIVGGTGKLGSGLAQRWARAGHTITLGSRDAAKARAHAEELSARGLSVLGGDNAWAAGEGEVVVLTVPYEAHGDTLRAIAVAIAGKVLIDVTVPLKPPKVSRVQLPAGQAAALEAQALLGASTPVVATLHHVSATHVADLTHAIECDALVAGDDARAKGVAIGLVRDLGMRGLDAGPLVNAIALESLTPVLIHLNRTYKSQGAGIVFTDLSVADKS